MSRTYNGTNVQPLDSIAFGLTIGLLADAFILRLMLMPHLLRVLGNSAWQLPKWLDRIIPQIETRAMPSMSRRRSATNRVFS